MLGSEVRWLLLLQEEEEECVSECVFVCLCKDQDEIKT